MSDSRVGGYPMGVTDATIERCYGGTREPRRCGNCRHFCGSDIHVDYGYCHLEFERAFDAEAPERKEGFWRLAKWAVAWLMENLLYCEDDEVLDVIAENPHRFIERYEMYREEVIRLGGKL